MEAVALHDFKATAEDELPFGKGDILYIVNMEDDPNWFAAELRGRSGLVPCNYIEMRPNPWYVVKCSREEAEERLLEMRSAKEPLQPEGAFLVRKSQATLNGFSLSVKNESSVLHFKVLQDETDSKFYLWSQKFDSINQLVDFHRRASISRTSTLLLQDRVPSIKFREDTKSQPRRVIAHFDFEANEPDELSFRRGDVINIIGEEDDNWWQGELDGRRGLFPSNYVGNLQQPVAPR